MKAKIDWIIGNCGEIICSCGEIMYVDDDYWNQCKQCKKKYKIKIIHKLLEWGVKT